MIKKAIFVTVMLAYAACYGSTVSQKIDRGLEFANAGRGDLALLEFRALLQLKPTNQERANALYNIAVLLLDSEHYLEAIHTLNQIDDGLFDDVLAQSPLTALQIVYAGAYSSITFAKHSLQKMADESEYNESDLVATGDALSSAQHYSQKIDALSKQKVIKDVVLTEFSAAEKMNEELAELLIAYKTYLSRYKLQQLDKSQLLDTLGASVGEQFMSVLELYLASNFDDEAASLYMQVYAKDYFPQLEFGFSHLTGYLQAKAAMHGFFVEAITEAVGELKDAYFTGTAGDALKSLSRLSLLVLLVQKEVVQGLLDGRITAFMNAQIFAGVPKLAAFWRDEWQRRNQFAINTLQSQAKGLDGLQQGLVLVLEKRLQRATMAQTEVDLFYWNVLSQDEGKTFLRLASRLHGASTVDLVLLQDTLSPLLERLTLQSSKPAVAVLSKCVDEESPLILFQNIMESWFLVRPQEALGFLLGLVQDECSALHVSLEADSFTARTDYHLLVHLLSSYLSEKSEAIYSQVFSDFSAKTSWFTDEKRQELDFFSLSLELGWFKEALLGETSTLQGITHAVDLGVDFQKKTMMLLRFQKSPNFAQFLTLATTMQSHLVATIGSGLDALPKKGPKIEEVIRLIADSKSKLPSQTKELASMQAVQDNLEKASKILHSLSSQSEADTSKTAPAKPQNVPQALKLSPDRSIRLLQEMEQEDKSLKKQSIPQVSGARPW